MENYLWWVVATSVAGNLILFALMWLSGRQKAARLERTQEIAPIKAGPTRMDEAGVLHLLKEEIEANGATDGVLCFPHYGVECRIKDDKVTILDERSMEVIGVYNIFVSVELTPA